jgi:hypothetical protein
MPEYNDFGRDRDLERIAQLLADELGCEVRHVQFCETYVSADAPETPEPQTGFEKVRSSSRAAPAGTLVGSQAAGASGSGRVGLGKPSRLSLPDLPALLSRR